jgi:hypothetical protein
MKGKYFALLCLTISFAQASQRNLCDDLIDGGTSSQAQIKKCQDKFGVSDFSKERATKAASPKSSSSADAKPEIKKPSNLEIKKFTVDELLDAGFGKPFYAMRIDYRYRPPKVKRITDGDALCTYLGFEKSIKSIVSAEVLPEDSDKKGLIIDTNFLGTVSKEPDLYHDDDLKFTIRKYVEITCVKRKDKSIDPSDEVYKKLTEDLLILAPEINPVSKTGNTGVNNGPRSGKEEKTPYGYTPIDWSKDSKDSKDSQDKKPATSK